MHNGSKTAAAAERSFNHFDANVSSSEILTVLTEVKLNLNQYLKIVFSTVR